MQTEPLRSGAVGADVVRAPQTAELLPAGRQLADEVLQTAVVRVTPGLGAHDVDAHLREQVPVRIELARGGVQKLEPRHVRRSSTVTDQLPVEDASEGVGGDKVL